MYVAVSAVLYPRIRWPSDRGTRDGGQCDCGATTLGREVTEIYSEVDERERTQNSNRQELELVCVTLEHMLDALRTWRQLIV